MVEPTTPRRHGIERRPVALACAAVLLGSLRVVVGLPDSDGIRRFWSGGHPGTEATLAAAGGLVWAAAGGVAAWLVLGAARSRSVQDDGLRTRLRVRRGWLMLTAGVVVLALGLLVHRHAPDLCCGDVTSARAAFGADHVP